MNALNTKLARYNMIEQQIRPWDVLDTAVLDLFASLPREDFVPERYRALAFTDTSIPLAHNQSMMPPKLEARLLQTLEIASTDRILEIGTGSGFLTACLARLGFHVHTVDLFEDFTVAARENLLAHDISNVIYHTADAGNGWHQGEFDIIAVTGSLPVEHRGFHEQLAIGGKLFLIVGTPPVMTARLITRVSQSGWYESNLFETSVPALIGAPKPEIFSF